MNDIILSVRDLHVNFRAYGGLVQAVRGVSFDLHRGETLAIVGESGSGKSVTIKAIMGILANNAIIASGEIHYDGKDLTKLKEEEFHEIRGKRIGLIFQDPLSALNPIMRIGKQIMEVLRLNQNMSKRDAKARALELMRDVGIPQPEKRFNQFPFQFSGGMRQRIVIAIALAGNSEILICDEPTTALDVTVQAKILELINEIKREHRLSVIFITHDLGVVANMADRVHVMYAGKIVEMGTGEEVFFEPAHPYTWALLSSMPDLHTKDRLSTIPGTPPNMIFPPKGDAFAARNEFAMKIDFEMDPPMFRITDTHYAATWLLHPKAHKHSIEMPPVLRERIERMRRSADHG
ncbi:MAG: ABC transporter ATP-binding protein [Bacillota bacterium]|nr:ABC transporter ATP-binding protein [Bacillota bacterium]